MNWLWKLIWGSNIRISKKPKKPKPMTTIFEPATPEPRYVCENCGMLVNTGHKHTRSECQTYMDDLTNPDMRVQHVLSGRNDPRVRLPHYYKEAPKCA